MRCAFANAFFQVIRSRCHLMFQGKARGRQSRNDRRFRELEGISWLNATWTKLRPGWLSAYHGEPEMIGITREF